MDPPTYRLWYAEWHFYDEKIRMVGTCWMSIKGDVMPELRTVERAVSDQMATIGQPCHSSKLFISFPRCVSPEQCKMKGFETWYTSNVSICNTCWTAAPILCDGCKDGHLAVCYPCSKRDGVYSCSSCERHSVTLV